MRFEFGALVSTEFLANMGKLFAFGIFHLCNVHNKARVAFHIVNKASPKMMD